jgi:hypothetical protein
LCRRAIADVQVTIMRALVAVTLLSLSWAVANAAEPPKLAVFDFEMIDTSLRAR